MLCIGMFGLIRARRNSV
ncbi:hypothetical protein [Glaciecola petra]